MGLNVHTVAFRPDPYKPICRLVRDYHDLDWDLGQDSNYTPRFPPAHNQGAGEVVPACWAIALETPMAGS
jgi:hypothetical protein